MARMIPSALRSDVESSAERRLFERLRDQTPSEVVGFHSVAWLLPGERGKARQGEADFVLAHPDWGIVALEVKGGTVRYDAQSGEWFTTGKSGENRIKDPVAQARRAQFSLRDLLSRSRRGGAEGVALGRAVAFPDARVDVRRLRPDVPREIVLDHGDLGRLDERVKSIFGYWQGDKPPLGSDGVKRLEDLLANSFELRAPLVFELTDAERALLELTEQQYALLDTLARHTRVAIAGCAGSGKTFLAAEKARRLANSGFRVLVVCFNVMLAQHLRRGLADADGVDVFTYDDLCRHVVREAGLAFPDGPEPGDEWRYYPTLRNAFAEQVDVAADRYGALIVDEAQDIHPDWWIPLQFLLEDPDESPLYVFYDDNQRIFAVPQGLPISDAPYQLTVNCRNTQRINAVVRAYYEGDTIQARGPEGLPVDTHFYTDGTELLEKLDANVRAWRDDAEVPAEQIALLTPRSPERSVLWTVDRLGGVRLTDDPWEKGKTLRSSIGRFKGLERLVVAMMELDGARDEALYIGFSRASTFLSIFCSKDARRRLPAELIRA
jgi:nuclease-like protein/AAA domain-containing protein